MIINSLNKKVIVIVMFLFLVFLINVPSVYGYEYSETKDGIENFPTDYQQMLKELKNKHPNWNFKAVYTKLDFNYVVSQEMVEGRSLISKSAFSDEWKRDSNDVEPGWVNASEYAVRYFLDPRNFLNEEKIFQFESSDFNGTSQTKEAIEKILAGTGLSNANYYIDGGEKKDLGARYSDVIYDAGSSNNVNAVHLASRIIQETGGTLGTLENGSVKKDSNGNVLYFNGRKWVTASRTLNGSYVSERFGDFRGVYNFFNIGAYCSAACNWCGNPFVHGLEKAKASGWNTPVKAINAAADYLRSKWIRYGQNTVYFEKFDVNFVPGGIYLFSGQYMTNISAASSESTLMYKGYSSSGSLDSSFTFCIPVYDNMTGSDNSKEKRLQVINCEGAYLNVRKSKGTDSTVIAKLGNGTLLTQILDDGTSWLKVRLDDGKIGYVYRDYVAEYIESSEVKVSKFTIASNEYSVQLDKYFTVVPNIEPENATNKNYTITIKDTNIAKVEDGKIKGIKVGATKVILKTNDGSNLSCEFTLNVKKDKIEVTDKISLSDYGYIYGFGLDKNVAYLKENIKTKYNMKLYSPSGNEMSDSDMVTTNTKLVLYDKNTKLYEYTLVIKADTNEDGKINSADLLKIVQYLKGKTTLNEKAADANSDGKINSADLLKIVQYLKGKTTIDF